MPVSGTLSNHFKFACLNKQIDIDTDTIKVLLMRNGFVFNRDNHEQRKNIKATTGAISLTFVASTKKMTRGSGSFITDGFVPGNRFTTDASLNPGPFTIVSVIALEIVVTETVVNEGPVTKTATANDELAAGNGYTQDTKTVTITLTEDDANDRAQGAIATFSWVASGGNIGPTPGVILYDDTDADDSIIGYLDFDGNVTANDGAAISISNAVLRLT